MTTNKPNLVQIISEEINNHDHKLDLRLLHANQKTPASIRGWPQSPTDPIHPSIMSIQRVSQSPAIVMVNQLQEKSNEPESEYEST